MLVQQHIKQLIDMALPYRLAGNEPTAFDKEYARLLSQIQPVKFGNTVQWTAAGIYDLAVYQVPRNADYLIVMRVECYTVNLTSGATDYGVFQPVPPGKAYWEITPSGTGTTRIVSDETMQSHVMCDVDEQRFFSAGELATLKGDFLVSPDGQTRNVRSLVYSYLIGNEIIERIGGMPITEPPSQGV